MITDDRIQRAKNLLQLAKYPEWQDFLDLVQERQKFVYAWAYAEKDAVTMAKFLGEAKSLDKVANLIQDEVKLVKRMIETRKGGEIK